MSTRDDIPHLDLPLRFANGEYVQIQQDTTNEAANCVKAILSYRRGTRMEDLNFGIIDPTFQTQPVDVEDIADAISTYEPRVDATIETEDQDDGTTKVNVRVTLPSDDMEDD